MSTAARLIRTACVYVLALNAVALTAHYSPTLAVLALAVLAPAAVWSHDIDILGVVDRAAEFLGAHQLVRVGRVPCWRSRLTRRYYRVSDGMRLLP